MNNEDIYSKISFIGIGVVKSGTTWLADCMREHPDVYIPKQKEVCYFDTYNETKNFTKGTDWYAKFFKNSQSNQKKGEFTTHYIYFPHSAKLIHNMVPHAKLIVCLRQPADMLYSFFWWKKANYETADLPTNFETAVDTNLEYIQRGMYYKQLKRYYDLFPRSQIKVFLHDEIKSDPLKVLREAFEFIGVDSTFIPPNYNKKINASRRPKSVIVAQLVNLGIKTLKAIGLKSLVWYLVTNQKLSGIYTKINKTDHKYPPIDQKTKSKLNTIFKEDILKLEKLIGKDLSTWLEVTK
jgi:hypothetical protein